MTKTNSPGPRLARNSASSATISKSKITKNQSRGTAPDPPNANHENAPRASRAIAPDDADEGADGADGILYPAAGNAAAPPVRPPVVNAPPGPRTTQAKNSMTWPMTTTSTAWAIQPNPTMSTPKTTTGSISNCAAPVGRPSVIRDHHVAKGAIGPRPAAQAIDKVSADGAAEMTAGRVVVERTSAETAIEIRPLGGDVRGAKARGAMIVGGEAPARSREQTLAEFPKTLAASRNRPNTWIRWTMLIRWTMRTIRSWAKKVWGRPPTTPISIESIRITRNRGTTKMVHTPFIAGSPLGTKRSGSSWPPTWRPELAIPTSVPGRHAGEAVAEAAAGVAAEADLPVPRKPNLDLLSKAEIPNVKRWTLLALVCLAVCGCNSEKRETATAGKAGASAAGQPKYRIAVIPKGTTHEFWKSVHAGAANAARELGNVEIVWKGTLEESNREGQINLVENFVTSEVDGICLAPLDSKALVRAVRYAKGQGIPTVIFDSGLDDPDTIVSYVATDNFHGGVLAARRLAEVLDKKGKVILLRYNVGSESTEKREEGFLETLAKEFPEIEVISKNEYSGTTPETSLSKCEALLTLHRDAVNGMFAVCEPNSTGMLKALEQEELAGKVKMIAFDPSPTLTQALRDRKLEGIVLQDPVKMGYLAVKTLVAHLEGQHVDATVSTGEFVATPDNMDTPEISKLLHPEQFED